MSENQRLTPIAYPANVTIRGVHFAMWDLGKIIHILVTHGALDRLEKPTDGDTLVRFGKHRGTFEQIANDKFVRGKTEHDDSLVVLPGDF
jgi:hypothetical protein